MRFRRGDPTHTTDRKVPTMNQLDASRDYIGQHRPFADRGTYADWTRMIAQGQDRDNVARLLGYEYDALHLAEVTA